MTVVTISSHCGTTGCRVVLSRQGSVRHAPSRRSTATRRGVGSTALTAVCRRRSNSLQADGPPTLWSYRPTWWRRGLATAVSVCPIMGTWCPWAIRTCYGRVARGSGSPTS
ncbi:hypothetical protein KPB2_5515 [Klebsiella pneumoniae Kb677]|nr:hypothetical protein KPB2_5515 [Klebsiella pneumoniae Kb677]